MPAEPTVLSGLRRELTRELFEELAALQCAEEEILGCIGTTEPKLEAWCRKTYRRPLREMLPMIRQDGCRRPAEGIGQEAEYALRPARKPGS